jgi:hypothetical protein
MVFGSANAALPVDSIALMEMASPVEASLLEHDASLLN